jgi:hypothetical protein
MSTTSISKKSLGFKSLSLIGVVVAGLNVISTLSASAANFTGSTTLDKLVGTGNTFTVGDKIFSDFTYALAGDAQPPAADVTVTGDNTDPLDPTVTFNGSFSGSKTGFGDIAIGFDVAVTDPTKFLISGLDLSLNGIIPGSSFTDVVTVTPPGFPLGSIVATVSGGGITYNPGNIITFPAEASVNVTQDINATGPFAFSIDTKSIHQTPQKGPNPIPEPGMVSGLLALAGLGIVSKLKKQKS